ncbi:hypothetical protein IAD21_06082 [Abditibacteriota bacterium]|nr:hypothetical protein IAD21_06082 [Abditibacteriota bacterium]
MTTSFLSITLFALALAGLPANAQQTFVQQNPLSTGDAQSGIIDSLTFGSAASEAAHELNAPNSDTVVGTLGEPARRLLPLAPARWEGGRMSFTLKVDPVKINYVTVRLSGDDVTENRLMLYVDGKQIGYRHLGDIEQLDYGTPEPAYKGRFFYNTTPIPLSVTQRKTQVQMEIRSLGRIWGYGSDFDQYQRPQTDPSRGIYRIYTHTEGFFVPPDDEKQGVAPTNAPVRTAPGPEVLEQVKARVSREVTNQLNGDKPLDQMHMQFLAKASQVKWTPAYNNPKTIERITASLDALFLAYRNNPKLAIADPGTWNSEWFGFGPTAEAMVLLQEELKPALDEPISDEKGGQLTRRAAYTEMMVVARDWHRENRRQYTNQSMINDLYGIYWDNRAIQVLDPTRALPEKQALRYLYESVGLQPWLGSEVNGVPQKPLGDSYYQLTDKGLTRELGYVGTYGEVLDWTAKIYNATRSTPTQEGDPQIKAQLLKIVNARTAFRYPALDADGNRVMRLEQVIGWRDSHYPGVVTYGQRAAWDGAPFQTAAATRDPKLIGYAQQMLADNQYFAQLQEQAQDNGFRVTAELMEWPDEYDFIKAQPVSPHRLPMSWDQPDSVFTDEDDGVVALKNGNELFYVSLYWRARFGINNLARVHYITPTFDRVAVVSEESQFEPSGMMYTLPNWTNMDFGNGGFKYPGEELHSALAGEQIPIAKIPDGVDFKPGQESPYAGKAQFYTLRYGPYLIGMNTTPDKTFDLQTPTTTKRARELVSGRNMTLRGVVRVGPKSTVVLYMGGATGGI